MQSLVERDAINLEEKKRFNTLIDLLSYEKIIFNGEFPLIESWGSFTNFDVSTFKSLAFLFALKSLDVFPQNEILTKIEQKNLLVSVQNFKM